MTDIYSFIDASPANPLAVAIRRLPPAENKRVGQPHIGVVYRRAGSAQTLLHLRFHCDLAKEPPTPAYHWIPSQLDPRLQALLADYMELIWQENEANIPFGIIYKGVKYFDLLGNLIRTGIGDGLTCATFVLASFQGYNLPLILHDTWPKKGNRVWQKHILDLLRAHSSPEHVAQQEPLVGQVARFTPEEVAGAFLIFEGEPIPYIKAKAQAKVVKQVVE